MRNKCLVAIATLVFTNIGLAQSDEVNIPTRFGELKANKDGDIQFKGKTVLPKVNVVDFSFDVKSNNKLTNSDVILVSQGTGNTCPGQFAYITVTADGAKATPTFGTCYDDYFVQPVQNGEILTLTMKNLGGKGTSKYVYEKGVVTKNGKPVK